MKKYLVLSAILFANQVSAMVEPSTLANATPATSVEVKDAVAATAETATVPAEVKEAATLPATPVEATIPETENPNYKLFGEIATALRAQSYSDTDILSLFMSIEKMKKLGLTDKQIIQRMEVMMNKGFVHTSKRNEKRTKILTVAVVVLIVTIIVGASYAWWQLSKKNTTINTLQPKADATDEIVRLAKATKGGPLAAQILAAVNIVADRATADRSQDDFKLIALYNLLNDDAAFTLIAPDALAGGKLQKLKVKA